ncbi:hypothetical protein R80B4_01956 [Fibrobacteres bacterium R8-0-B4]
MARVSLFVDGFNLYHALDNDRFRQFKWLNLRRLAELYFRGQDSLSDIFYFTAFVTWNQDKVLRHKLYIRVLESLGVKPIYGKFRKVTKRCRICDQSYDSFEEKETDVNIAIELLEQARLDTYDRAIILSGDSDQAPAIRTIKKNYPHKEVCALIPPSRTAKFLIKEADFHFKIKRRHLLTSRFQDAVTLADGTVIYCPERWKDTV